MNKDNKIKHLHLLLKTFYDIICNIFYTNVTHNTKKSVKLEFRRLQSATSHLKHNASNIRSSPSTQVNFIFCLFHDLL